MSNAVKGEHSPGASSSSNQPINQSINQPNYQSSTPAHIANMPMFSIGTPSPAPTQATYASRAQFSMPVSQAADTDPLAVMFSSTFQTPDGIIYWEMRTEQDRNQYLKVKHAVNEELVDPPVCILTMNTEEAQVCPHQLEFTDVLKPINLSSVEALTQFSVSPLSRMEWKTFLKTHQVNKSAKVQGIASITYEMKNIDSDEIETKRLTFGVGWRTTRDAKRRGSLLEAALGRDRGDRSAAAANAAATQVTQAAQLG